MGVECDGMILKGSECTFGDYKYLIIFCGSDIEECQKAFEKQ